MLGEADAGTPACSVQSGAHSTRVGVSLYTMFCPVWVEKGSDEQRLGFAGDEIGRWLFSFHLEFVTQSSLLSRSSCSCLRTCFCMSFFFTATMTRSLCTLYMLFLSRFSFISAFGMGAGRRLHFNEGDRVLHQSTPWKRMSSIMLLFTSN